MCVGYSYIGVFLYRDNDLTSSQPHTLFERRRFEVRSKTHCKTAGHLKNFGLVFTRASQEGLSKRCTLQQKWDWFSRRIWQSTCLEKGNQALHIPSPGPQGRPKPSSDLQKPFGLTLGPEVWDTVFPGNGHPQHPLWLYNTSL